MRMTDVTFKGLYCVVNVKFTGDAVLFTCDLALLARVYR